MWHWLGKVSFFSNDSVAGFVDRCGSVRMRENGSGSCAKRGTRGAAIIDALLAGAGFIYGGLMTNAIVFYLVIHFSNHIHLTPHPS